MANKTVFPWSLQKGDVVSDPSGDYEQYGPITNVARKGISYRAETENGPTLVFAASDRVQVRC